MSVNFAKYERSSENLESLGTVLSLVGKDGSLNFIPKNLNDHSKRVVIVLKKKNGTSAMITCSEGVSKGLRDKTINLGQVLNFEVLEGESGIPYISMPGGLIEVAVKTIKVQDYAVSLDSSLIADLI